jgi:hypothetical protein
MRGEAAKLCRDPPTRHRPPPGRRIAPPDDRLQRTIQYSEALLIEPRSHGVLDTPHARGMTIFVTLRGADLPAVAQRAKAEATKQSSFWFAVTMDCFAEPVIGRAFARPVGSQ